MASRSSVCSPYYLTVSRRKLVNRRTLLRLAAALTLAAAPGFSQTITGRLVGTVVDPTKAPVPEVQVTITNQDTGVVWHVKTDARGDYIAPSLPSGTYRIQAERQGFRNSVSADNVV